jgi:aminopeptidase YwaD
VAAGLGLVSYTVTNSCGSVAATKMLTVIPAADCPAQTELPVPQGDVRVFPNPAKDILHVQLPDGVSVANIVITDLPGRTLKSAGISSASATVSLAGIPAGVYILSIEAGGQTTRTKFLISE